MTKRRSTTPRVVLNALEQIHLNAAGIDIGAEEIYVAVPPDRDERSVRCFGVCTEDLEELAAWLIACRIDTVAMESTGVYWIPLYEILEGHGLRVCLVNARHLKNVSGRKTDVLDCQWLQQLLTYGLLQASFRPPEAVVALRSLVRQRQMLVEYRAAHIQHLQKALTVMNLRLTSVLSDITGVTGMKIIRAIAAGERDATVLAHYREGGCAKSEGEIVRALQGHYQSEQVFILQQALAQYDFYEQQIQQCDGELEKRYNQFEIPQPPGTPPPAPRGAHRRKNQAHFDLAQAVYRLCGVDLTQIDGIDALTAQKVLSETGVDMSRWPSVKHFAAWLHLCPNNQITGGKVQQRGVQPTTNRASTALRVAALSLRRNQSALGAFFRHIQARHGIEVAVTATAHKLARIIYYMLRDHTPYQDIGAEEFEKKQRAQALRSLNRRAAQLGMRVEPVGFAPS